jgi:hypothetical protein
MPNDCDEAFSKFRELMEREWSSLSESDTRAKILDPLFTQVLGWAEKDISREPYANAGYLDYLFASKGVRWFVLEAKALEKT